MPKPWSAVATSPEYMALPPEKKTEAKNQYFDQVVAPQLPEQQRMAARTQFFGMMDTPVSPAQAMAKSQADSGDTLAAYQGLTFGFGDEIDAGMTGVATGVKNLAARAMGGKPAYSAGEAYDAMLSQERDNLKQFEKAHPGRALLDEIVGGALNPASKLGGKWITDAPGVVGKLGRGAAVGAGFGAASGFGSGEGGFGERAKDSGIGGVIGAGLGMVPPAAGALAKTGARTAGVIGKVAVGLFKDMTGMTPEEAANKLSPEQIKKYEHEALDYIKRMMDSEGKSPKDLTEDPSHKLGQPVTAAEAMGRQGKNQISSIGRRPGTTGEAAETQFRLRGDERSERLQKNLAQASGLKPEHVEGNMEQLSEDLRSKSAPLYEKAESHPPVDVAQDEELLHLFSQDNMQQALQWAGRLARNEGRPWTYSEADRRLSWKDLDYVKRGLQTVINRTHKNALGHMITDDASRADLKTLDAYREHLFSLNPDYKAAVAHSGEPIRLEGIYKDAPKLMSGNVTERQFDKKINDMSPAELDALKSGWTNDVYTKLQNGKFQAKDLKQPVFLAKAKRLLGEQQARQFVEEISQELRLKEGEQKIPPQTGSQTAPLLHSAEKTDEQTDSFIHSIGSNLIRRGIPKATLLAVNDALYAVFKAAKTPEQEALRNEIGKLLLLKPDELKLKLEGHGKTPVSPKAKEIMTMLSHVGYGSAGPVSETATHQLEEPND